MAKQNVKELARLILSGEDSLDLLDRDYSKLPKRLRQIGDESDVWALFLKGVEAGLKLALTRKG